MKVVNLICLFFFISNGISQRNLNNLLAAGISDAQTYASSYIDPATESLVYAVNNGWFNHGNVSERFSFEISLIANTSFVKERHRKFIMNSGDYQNIEFVDGSPSKEVATILGHNDPEILVTISYDNPIFMNRKVELVLPTGIMKSNINFIPTTFLQASFTPFKGTQLKARFFPKVDLEGAKVGLYGIGIQQEFTEWFANQNYFPLSISGLLAYTHVDGKYDFTDTDIINGENQRVETDVNTALFHIIVSTKLRRLNFYGGLGYLLGYTKTDFLGTYVIREGVIRSESVIDPFSIDSDYGGVRATIGSNLNFGFFNLNLDYSIAEFNSASLGLNFSF